MLRSRPSLLTAALVTATALTVPTSLLTASPATAAGPYERGPAPTTASISATTGPFAVATTSVSDAASPGFGAANITYPTSTTQGTFGVVAISPGFTASESTVAWLRPRLASQGFVVISINTNSRYDSPGSRGDQLLAALDYITQRSAVRTRVDASRAAVIGHSMGGGGTLEAAKDRPALKATVGLTPYNTDKTWPEVRSASLFIGAEDDTVAPVDRHAISFYASVPSSTPKAYLELGGASHYAPISPNALIAANTISWLKTYVDSDPRYRQFLCPGPAAPAAGAVSDYRNTCTL